jgi:Holliday junction resolvase RusA-like endonuclease
MQAMAGKEPLRGALRCDMTFIMPRPKYHFNKKGLKPNAEYFHSKKPDKLKLARSTQDALTGIVWEDDSQDAIGEVKKIYGTPTGCKITITEIKERSDEK